MGRSRSGALPCDRSIRERPEGWRHEPCCTAFPARPTAAPRARARRGPCPSPASIRDRIPLWIGDGRARLRLFPSSSIHMRYTGCARMQKSAAQVTQRLGLTSNSDCNRLTGHVCTHRSAQVSTGRTHASARSTPASPNIETSHAATQATGRSERRAQRAPAAGEISSATDGRTRR